MGLLFCLSIVASQITSVFIARHYALENRKENERTFQKFALERSKLTFDAELRTHDLVERYQKSVGYVSVIYRVDYHGQRVLHERVGGTGFVVGRGLLATNRHIAEPWFGDRECAELFAKGAWPTREEALVFFPGMKQPIKLNRVILPEKSDDDIAIMQFDPKGKDFVSLPIADGDPQVGQDVGILGYPSGIRLMVAKSSGATYDYLQQRSSNAKIVTEIADRSLIRPTFTPGQIGDVMDDKVVYSAGTAPGASGSPVLRTATGAVIAVNTAFLTDFSGASFGFSAKALVPLIRKAETEKSNDKNGKK